jgi:peptide/nickel transport system substrate-binding protein
MDIFTAESDRFALIDSLTMSALFGRQLASWSAGFLASASALAFCFGGCTTPSRLPLEKSQGPVTLTIGFPYPSEQDPLRGAGEAARLISHEALTTQNLNGRPVSRLAEGWTESSDGLSWTIRLRPAAVFHDGSPVDAVSVKSSLEQFLSSAASRFALGLQDVSSMEASGPYTLTIRLRQRSNLLLDDLDNAPITKRDAKGAVIGTGPYVITSTSAGEIVMSSFRQYYRGISAIDRLVWRLYPTVRTAWAATMRGEVDFLYEVGPDSREFLESEASVELYSFLRNYVYGAVFNARRPVFRNPEIRRALNYAVDRKTIVELAFRGHATVANGPAWPLHWAYEASAEGYVYDPARGAASLERALGTRRAENGRRSTNFKFVCLIPDNFQLWERIALIVQRDLAKIGVDMALEAVPFDVFNQRIAVGDFDVVLMEMVSGFSVTRQFYFWRSSSLANFSGYHNTLVDSSLEGIRGAAGEAEYRETFHQFQRATFNDPPAIFLAWSQTARAVSRRFDVIRAPGGDIRMTISDWKLARTSTRDSN